MRTPIALNIVLTFMCVLAARANVPAPPQREQVRDSLALRWEEGAELTRWLGSGRWDAMAGRTRVLLKTDWTTALSRGLSSDGRVRHDVRWSAAASRPLQRKLALWGGATGQHYVDRPRSSSAFGQETRSHFLRVGAGPSMRWNDMLRTTHSAGMVLDSRGNMDEAGLGTWHKGELAFNSAPEVRHDFNADFDYESPGARNGSHAELLYNLNHDYVTARNSADFSFGWTRRDVLTAENQPSQLREETSLRAADEIEYELGKTAKLRGSGDVRYFDSQLDDRRGNESRLEELESGIEAALDLHHEQSTATISAGARGVSQNVRGEILTGRKTELKTVGRTVAQGAKVTLVAAFSKYKLDTRSEQNFDDRDELAWRFESGITAPLTPSLDVQIQALADLNHLVYIFASNSANNRWTRLFLLTTRFAHVPSTRVLHMPEFRISANYQAYDFELNPRQVRSTAFRRVALGDSLAVQASAKWSVALRGEVAREELGRLYWQDFAEERSDRTDVLNSALQLIRELAQNSNAALGIAYSARRGDRFEAGGQPQRAQDLKSWGPLVRINWKSSAWFVTGGAQWVMQSEIGRDDRTFVSGTLTAGRTW